MNCKFASPRSTNTAGGMCAHRRRACCLVLAGGVQLAQAHAEPVQHVLPLNGDDWRLVSREAGEDSSREPGDAAFASPDAVPATVPGDVHWDLERAGKIPPIYYGTNSRQIGWVAGKAWWYRKTFATPHGWEGKRIRLCFDGVDYLCDVWLNGRHLGRHEGQFTPFTFDVGDILAPGGQNRLSILIPAAPESVRKLIAQQQGEWVVMQAMRPAYPYWKSMTNAGWDWGADILTRGIWKDVALRVSDSIAIDDPLVLPHLEPPYDRAELEIRLNIASEKDLEARIVYRVECETSDIEPVVVSRKIALPAGAIGITNTVEVSKPRLWWPNGYGDQEMYRVRVEVYDENGNLLDRGASSFGIRDLVMLENPESRNDDQYVDYANGREVKDFPDPRPSLKYLVQINGRKIFGRGGNWIPCDLLFGRPDTDFYERLIRLAAEANHNLFRIWGGGLIEKKCFFDLCDRYGIMLYAEFPNGGVRLPETDKGLAITAQETREILPLMMNHPCVVRYGGGNEWYRDASNSRQMAQLRRICNEVDPTRPYHDPDPETIAQRHGPHGYVYPEHYATYNTGRPLTAGPVDPLEWTEYGAAAASCVDTLKAMMPAKDLWPLDRQNQYWRWHKAFGAYGDDNWLGLSSTIQLFGEPSDLETMVACSQLVQAEALRYANQAMRRHKWHRSACVSWTYNEPWPNAAHGCIVEYSGKPKMAYYYVKQSYAPVDISALYSNLEWRVDEPVDVKLWITNDRTEKRSNWEYRYRIYDSSGRLYKDVRHKADIAGESSVQAGAVDWVVPRELSGRTALLWIELADAAGEVVSRNLYTFGVAGSLSMPRDISVCEWKQNPAVATSRWTTRTSPQGFYDVSSIPDKEYKPVRTWFPGKNGAFALFGSWGACRRHTDKARFIVDLDGDFGTVTDQTSMPFDASLMADQSTSGGEPGQWSGFMHLGDFKLGPASAVRLEASAGSEHNYLGVSMVVCTPKDYDHQAVVRLRARSNGFLGEMLSAPASTFVLSRVSWSKLPDGSGRLDLSIDNTGDVPVLFAELGVESGINQQIECSDNYIFLPPGEGRRIEMFLHDWRNSGVERPDRVFAKAWNSPKMVLDL